MKVPTPVLRAVKKPNNPATACSTAGKVITAGKQLCELRLDDPRIREVHESINLLLTVGSPDYQQALHRYLHDPSEKDTYLLNAWAKCGANDRARTINLRMTDIARSSMTPLGVACLITYARAWLAEHENRLIASPPVAGSTTTQAARLPQPELLPEPEPKKLRKRSR